MRKSKHDHFQASALLITSDYLEKIECAPLSDPGIGISPRDQTSGEVIVYLWGETISLDGRPHNFKARLRFLPSGAFHTGRVTIGSETSIFHVEPEIMTA